MIWRRKKKEKYIRASNNKKLIAGLLGIDRKSIYYASRLDLKDQIVRNNINNLHLLHPAYGHKRVALALKLNRKKILRIMKKYGIKPPRRKGQKFYTTRSANNHNYTNLIKGIIPVKPSQIFVSDLTYLKYQDKFFYLAAVEDIFTREIISAEVSDRHDSILALSVIKGAMHKAKIPDIFHTDQGSEFMAGIITDYLEGKGVKISVSDKGSPWQNGYKESFFGRFKDEIGDLNRFSCLGELIEEIYSYIYYYNNLRIHTSLKMTPSQFRQKHIDSVSRKMGT